MTVARRSRLPPIDARNGPTVSGGPLLRGEVVALGAERGSHLRSDGWLGGLGRLAGYCFFGHVVHLVRQATLGSSESLVKFGLGNGVLRRLVTLGVRGRDWRAVFFWVKQK
jgi:hypothetical protein